MPSVSHRGQRIHYTVTGSGPPVVLLHGLLQDRTCWSQNGFVAALAESFSVTCIDSLGHGLSDKPEHPTAYDQKQRAGDVIAVLDALGHQRAHLLGYSMGAWMAVGVARFHPERLASLVLGGWDIVDGLPRVQEGPLTFDFFMSYARWTAPELTAWVQPEHEPGLQACFEALHELDGAEEAVRYAGCPAMLWCGRTDPYHDAMQAFAEAGGLPFLETTGDHLTAMTAPEGEMMEAIRAFLERNSTSSQFFTSPPSRSAPENP